MPAPAVVVNDNDASAIDRIGGLGGWGIMMLSMYIHHRLEHKYTCVSLGRHIQGGGKLAARIGVVPHINQYTRQERASCDDDSKTILATSSCEPTRQSHCSTLASEEMRG